MSAIPCQLWCNVKLLSTRYQHISQLASYCISNFSFSSSLSLSLFLSKFLSLSLSISLSRSLSFYPCVCLKVVNSFANAYFDTFSQQLSVQYLSSVFPSMQICCLRPACFICEISNLHNSVKILHFYDLVWYYDNRSASHTCAILNTWHIVIGYTHNCALWAK